MIAVAILAIIITGVYSVALAARRLDVDANPQEQALEGIRSASAALGNYVVDWSYVKARHDALDASIDDFAPNEPAVDGTPRDETRKWHLPGDTCGEYALSSTVSGGCVHDASAYLGQALRTRARLTYAVATNADGAAQVQFEVSWP
ncbi:MAG: hypothetical protein HY554_10900 [Elusimicrobia bacterium]|nr:hypothetical protein [Elusimicrobiota bacterium]